MSNQGVHYYKNKLFLQYMLGKVCFYLGLFLNSYLFITASSTPSAQRIIFFSTVTSNTNLVCQPNLNYATM